MVDYIKQHGNPFLFYEQNQNFGVTPLSEPMVANAEAFLMKILGSHFSTRLHIKRAYYQCHRWSNALSAADGLDPLDYGYIESYDFGVRSVIINDFRSNPRACFRPLYPSRMLCNHERILPQPLIYIILAFTTWVAALYFFLNKSISWALTPAQSRAYNHTCDIWDFYDKHDIWHFLSAASMFFSFMVLLTLDDDLIRVHRSNIPVF
uniref:Uncharacterized protein n=1 Tax=Timema tahoe TaxID=61484 RepID=A0A7R9IT05_9NEOP|nr:unnamed protein product [Timema tahoe]